MNLNTCIHKSCGLPHGHDLYARVGLGERGAVGFGFVWFCLVSFGFVWFRLVLCGLVLVWFIWGVTLTSRRPEVSAESALLQVLQRFEKYKKLGQKGRKGLSAAAEDSFSMFSGLLHPDEDGNDSSLLIEDDDAKQSSASEDASDATNSSEDNATEDNATEDNATNASDNATNNTDEHHETAPSKKGFIDEKGILQPSKIFLYESSHEKRTLAKPGMKVEGQMYISGVPHDVTNAEVCNHAQQAVAAQLGRYTVMLKALGWGSGSWERAESSEL